MNVNPQSLSPTLWRTCRVLANPTRLGCLGIVVDNPGVTVETVAAKLHITEVNSSLCLRALQSRGLLSSTRKGRWVFYSPETDPKVETAKPLLDAVSKALHAKRFTLDDIEKAVTAYTHPRRIILARLLHSRGPLAVEVLAGTSDISLPALHRHLRKLIRRGIVVEADGKYALRTPRNALAKELLLLVVGP